MTGSEKHSEHVKSRWEFFHNEAAEGRIHTNSIANLGADVAREIRRLDEGKAAGPLEADDIIRAEILHRDNLDRFQMVRDHAMGIRSYLLELSQATDRAANEFNKFVVQLLAYANGAAALGSLAYLGASSNSHLVLNGIVYAMGAWTLGFLAILLSAHLLVYFNFQASARYRGATLPSVSDDEVYGCANRPSSWVERFMPPVLGWVSAIFLFTGASIILFSLA